MSFVPKQSIQNQLSRTSIASKEFADKVKEAVENRISIEGSTVTVVGDEKDGFKSLSMSIDKGSAKEGPIVTVMTEGVNGATVKKTVSLENKLAGVTGKSSVGGEVLNESVCQATPKAMSSVLSDVVGMADTKIQQALSQSSPIPTKVKNAVKEEQSGGVVKNLASEAVSASSKVAAEVKKPFGSSNKFGSIGSGISNILGQITAIASNASNTFKDPTSNLKLSNAKQLLNEENIKVDTPDIIKNTGKTNLQEVVTKSETTNPKVKDTVPPIIVGKTDALWQGINSRTPVEGGDFDIPIIKNKPQLKAEMLNNDEREITTMVILHLQSDNYAAANAWHITGRNFDVEKVGSLATRNPFDYGIQAHLFLDRANNLTKMVPLNRGLPLKMDEKKKVKYAGCLSFMIVAKTIDSISSSQWRTIDAVIETFLEVYPGGEVLGMKNIKGNEAKNNPDWDVKEYVLQKFGKDSVLDDEVEYIPTASEMADRNPKNVVTTSKKPVGAIPVASETVDEVNAAAVISEADYEKVQSNAADFIRQKQDLVSSAINSLGSGNLGSFKVNASTFDKTSNNLLKDAQNLKLSNLKNNKVFDAVSKAFKRLT